MSRRLTRAPPPPKHLSDRAQAEWKRLAPLCVSMRTLTQPDLRSFELLCSVLAAEAEAREALKRDGMLVSTAAGGSKPHPALRAAEKATEQAIKLLQAFGLNHEGRRHRDIRAEDEEDDEDEYG